MAPSGDYSHEPRGTVRATLALRGARRDSGGCVAGHAARAALKELVETRGWLRFVIIAELLPAKRIEAVLDECDQLCRILGKSVATAKGKRRKNDERGGDSGRT